MAMMHNTAMGAKQEKRGVDMLKLPIIDRIGTTMEVKRVSPETRYRFIKEYEKLEAQKNGS